MLPSLDWRAAKGCFSLYKNRREKLPPIATGQTFYYETKPKDSKTKLSQTNCLRAEYGLFPLKHQPINITRMFICSCQSPAAQAWVYRWGRSKWKQELWSWQQGGNPTYLQQGSPPGALIPSPSEPPQWDGPGSHCSSGRTGDHHALKEALEAEQHLSNMSEKLPHRVVTWGDQSFFMLMVSVTLRHVTELEWLYLCCCNIWWNQLISFPNPQNYSFLEDIYFLASSALFCS